MKKRIMLIDSDTASDDAVAILMAAKHPDVELAGVTIVSGNVPLKQGVKNALYTLELCGSNCPVYPGACKPILQKVMHTKWYHGSDGMGEKHYPDPKKTPEKEHAVDVIIKLAKKHCGELELVTLGPLTNLAEAILKEPVIADMLKRVVMMAGAACTVGNVTPAAEYNVWADPEAAQIVMTSGIKKLEMVGWEMALGDAILSKKDISEISNIKSELAHFAIDCNIHALRASVDWLGGSGLIQNDPIAMAIALNPELSVKNGFYKVEVELNGKLTRGMTIVDERSVVGTVEGFTEEWKVRKPNVHVHHKIDSAGWKNLLKKSLSN